MATKQAQTGTPTLEAALDQIKELNEQFIKGAHQAGKLYLDSYERGVDQALEFERRLAGVTQQEWLKEVIGAQTELTRELTTSYTTAVRSLLK